MSIDPSTFGILKEALEKSGITPESKKILGRVISGVYDYFSFKLDPWKRLAHKKAIVEKVKQNQLEFVSRSMQILTDRKLDSLKNKSDEEIMVETFAYLQGDVFLEFVEKLKDGKTNWKGGTRQDTKEFYDESSWWDLFMDLTTRRQEPWRARVFAEAMKVQVTTGDYVDYTTLWKLAMLPPHSWLDMTDYLSLAGEIYVNGKRYKSFMAGTFARISRVGFTSANGSRRLMSDLDVNLTEDGLGNTETGPVVLRKVDRNEFRLQGKVYLINSDDYHDQFDEDNDLADTEGSRDYFQLYGLWLSKTGEEILQLHNEFTPNPEAFDVFEKCREALEEDGLRFEEI